MFAVGLVVEWRGWRMMDCGAFPLEITRAEPPSTPALFSVALWALPPAAAAFGGSMPILETKHMSGSPQGGIQKRGFQWNPPMSTRHPGPTATISHAEHPNFCASILQSVDTQNTWLVASQLPLQCFIPCRLLSLAPHHSACHLVQLVQPGPCTPDQPPR
jgi:hypothetical protein